MGHQVLVTFDLLNASDEQRKKFNEILKKEKWTKIESLTTTWKISFLDGITRSGALSTIKRDLESSKTQCRIEKIEYAVQLALEPIEIGKI